MIRYAKPIPQSTSNEILPYHAHDELVNMEDPGSPLIKDEMDDDDDEENQLQLEVANLPKPLTKGSTASKKASSKSTTDQKQVEEQFDD